MLCLGWVDGGAGMTENEAIDELNASIDLAKMCTENLERKREVQGYETAIKALEEIQQYREIGTVEECRAAMEKQTAKKVKSISQVKDGDSYVGLIGRCPCCGDILEEDTVYCDCGQRLDWGTSDETD